MQLIKERSNICKQIHLPAQSGSNVILEAMDRGYSRESYLELVDRIKTVLPSNGIRPKVKVTLFFKLVRNLSYII